MYSVKLKDIDQAALSNNLKNQQTRPDLDTEATKLI
jgi:hypothetical protein